MRAWKRSFTVWSCRGACLGMSQQLFAADAATTVEFSLETFGSGGHCIGLHDAPWFRNMKPGFQQKML